jgi:hypothetical protein
MWQRLLTSWWRGSKGSCNRKVAKQDRALKTSSVTCILPSDPTFHSCNTFQ